VASQAAKTARSRNTGGGQAIRHTREESRARILAAATELVRESSFHELSVAQVMNRAGLERTIFYRHFDDLSDLLLQVSLEAIEGLFNAQVDLSAVRGGDGDPAAIRAAIEPVVRLYQVHGPVLRATSEAGAADPQIKERGDALRRRFNELVAAELAQIPKVAANPPADLNETARALNLLNEIYLRDAFGGEPRVTAETAIQTLAEIWIAFLDRDDPDREES
jgi:AcrR family transcriptional regulator